MLEILYLTPAIVKYILLFISIIYSSQLRAQFIGIDILGGKDKMYIPFQYENGFIIIEMMFNRFLPQRFIFDTGAEHTILFDKQITDILGIPYDREIKILGSDLSLEMSAHICRQLSFTFENVPTVYRDILVLDEDYLMIREANGINVDGLLGGGFFKGLVVQINYRKGRIELYHPDQYRSPRKSTVHDIDITNHKPYLSCDYVSADAEYRDTNELQLLLDTGAAISFMLFIDTDSTIVVPERTIPGNLGQGLGGTVLGLMGKSGYIGLDQYGFHRPLTGFQSLDSLVVNVDEVDRNGIIGNLVLSRFETVGIDYTYEKLYLKPSKDYNEAFEYDKSGLNIYAIGPKLNQYFVQSVIKESPAYEAGVRPGDIITRIGWWSTRWYSLERITNKLAGKVGKKIKLTLKRGEEKIKVSFRLRDLFDEENKA